MESVSESCESLTGNPVAGTGQDKLVAEKEQLESRQRELNVKIGRAKRLGQDTSDLIEQNREVSKHIERIEAKLAEEESDRTTSTEDTLVTNVLTTTEAFRDLQDEWTELMAKSNVYSPFMMWEWLYPWWKYFGHNKRLRLITVRDEETRLVGLAPMMLGFTEDGRCDPGILAFVGSGEEGPRGQYFSFIVGPRPRERILRAIVECLRELRAEWKIVRLWRVRQDDLYHTLLDILSQYDDLSVIIERKGAGVHGSLPATMEDFIASVPCSTKRSYLRNQENKLKRKYTSLRHDVCRSVQELPQFTSTIHELNIRRHQTKTGNSAWTSVGMQECYEETAKLLFENGCFRAELLRVDGKAVAGRTGIVRNGTYFAYESGFGPEFAEDRVGVVLLGLLIEDCIQKGLTHFDWLGAHDYMHEYFADEQTVLELTVFHNNSSSLRYVGSHLWSRGVKAQIRKVLPWPTVKRLLRKVRKR